MEAMASLSAGTSKRSCSWSEADMACVTCWLKCLDCAADWSWGECRLIEERERSLG